MPAPLIYAIDFGTSNSLLAAARPKETLSPIPLDKKNHKDESILRSLMHFTNNGEVHFGSGAIRSYRDQAGDGRFIRSIKKYLPAKSFSGTQIGGKIYSLEELIGRFLREMKVRADEHFGGEADGVVLGRPAKYSGDPEKDALAVRRMEKAASLAGFKNIHFCPEPLAAAYGYRKQLQTEKLVLIVDLGGGTSDFTVIRLHPGEVSAQDVLSLGGVSIAGDAIDGSIMTHKIAKHFGSEIQYSLPMSNNVLTMPPSLKYGLSSPADITMLGRSDIMFFLEEVQRSALGEEANEKMDQLFHLIGGNLGFAIFNQIELAKIQMCSDGQCAFLFETDEIFVQENLKYEEFVEWSSEKVEKIFECLEGVIAGAGIRYGDIDLVCCTGGTAKLPEVTRRLGEVFRPDQIQTYENFHSVIQGLSEEARTLF